MTTTYKYGLVEQRGRHKGHTWIVQRMTKMQAARANRQMERRYQKPQDQLQARWDRLEATPAPLDALELAMLEVT